MPETTNDDLVRQARERMHEQISKCAERAAQKVISKLKGGKAPSVAALAELIAQEFQELNP